VTRPAAPALRPAPPSGLPPALLGAAALLLAACAGAPATDPDPAAAPAAPPGTAAAARDDRALRLPPAVTGEACALSRAPAPFPAALDAFLLTCGAAQAPAATIAREIDPRTPVDEAVAGHPWLAGETADAACGDPAFVAFAGTLPERDGVLRACAGGRPRQPVLAGAAVVGRLLVTFVAAPQAVPVVEAVLREMVEPGEVPANPARPRAEPAAEAARRAARGADGAPVPFEVQARLAALAREAADYAGRGDADGALLALGEARPLHEAAWGPDHPGAVDLRLDEAGIAAAAGLADRAAAALAGLGPAAAASPFPGDTGRLRLAEARAALASRDPEAVAQALRAPPDAPPASVGWELAAAGLLLDAGLPDAAAERVAAAAAAAAGQPRGGVHEPGIAAAEAELALRRGDRGAARAALDRAAAAQERLHGPGPALAALLERRADLAAADGDAVAASRWRGEAFGMRAAAADADAGVPAAVVSARLDALAAAPGGLDPDAALRAVQAPGTGTVWRARARMADAAASASPATAERYAALARAREAAGRARLRLAEARADRGPGAGRRLAGAEALAAAADRAADAASRELARLAPAHAHLRAPPVLDAADVARRLRPGEALLALHVGDAWTAAVLVSADGRAAAHRRGPGAAALAARAAAAAAGGAGGAEAAAALRRDLLEPFGAALDGVRALLVVPDGPLHGLPPSAAAPPGVAAAVLPTVSTLLAVRPGDAGPGRPGAAADGPLLAAAVALRAPSEVPCLRLGEPEAVAPVPDPSPPVDADAAAALARAAGTGPLSLRRDLPRGGGAPARAAVLAAPALLPPALSCRTEPALVGAGGGLLTAGRIAAAPPVADTVLLPAASAAPGRGEALSALADAFLWSGVRRVAAAAPGAPAAAVRRDAEAWLRGGPAGPALVVYGDPAGPAR
jgi:hypothetical protein